MLSKLFPVAAGCATLLTAGCATAYREPPVGTPVATLDYHLAGMPAGSFVNMWLIDSPKCQDAHFLKGSMANESTVQSYAVAAGSRVYLLVKQTDAGGPRMATCTNLVSFVPEQGQRYGVTQVFFGNGRYCRLNVVNVETGAEPGSLAPERLLNTSCPLGAFK